MRYFRSWWDGLVFSSRHNPPQLVEAAMLIFAMLTFLLWWVRQDWQYLVLYISYIVGVTASILVRETVAPSPQTHLIRFAAVGSLLVVLSFVVFYTLRSLHLA